jgi:hypothetical protein
MNPEQIQSSGLAENIQPRSGVDVAGEVLYGAKISVSGSANFIKSMTMSDLVNATVTTIAHSRGADHALPGMPSTDGITDVQGGYFFSSAVVAGGAWGITGMIGLSIFIIGNIYMTMHKRLNAHHDAVVATYKCYGVLLRIENFLKVAQIYCTNYGFQIDSLEIQEDLTNIYKLLDEVTTPDDVFDVYTNIINGRTFRLETVDGNVIPVPEVKPTGLGRMKYFANTFAGIRRVTLDMNSWSTRFNSIMNELNAHFTLLIGEFFILNNLHQLTTSHEKNSSFASSLLTPSVNNPVWCIQLQIMLAPILRARVILFSCALSTNTALCRQTINSEMQELDKARGFGASIKAYLNKMYRLYKPGAKQINIKPFVDTMNAAISDVESSVYYINIPKDYNIVKVYIGRIKDNLKPTGSVTQENVSNIVDILDEIHNIVLECGRLNPTTGYASIEPFHSVQRSMAASILPKQPVHKNIRSAYDLQTKPFSYGAESYNSVSAIKDILAKVCEKASKEPVNFSSYDVDKYFTETESQIAHRIKKSYVEFPENIEYMTILISTQHQYNRLYARVVGINPSARGTSGIVVQRGRDLAACILLLERICVNAITIAPNIIREICQKCIILLDKEIGVTQVNMLSIFGPDTDIREVIARVLDVREPVIQRDRRGNPGGYARLSSLSPVDEAQKEDPAAAIQQSSISSGTSSSGKREVVKPAARPFANFFTAQGSSSISDPRAKHNRGGKRRVRTCKINKIKSNNMYKTSRRHRNRSCRKGSRRKHSKYTRRQNN